jgi:hypothetical protein
MNSERFNSQPCPFCGHTIFRTERGKTEWVCGTREDNPRVAGGNLSPLIQSDACKVRQHPLLLERIAELEQLVSAMNASNLPVTSPTVCDHFEKRPAAK